MASIDKGKVIQEILELFEYQWSLLTRIDKLEKMKLRQRTRDIVLPAIRMNSQHPKIIMNIMEDKLDDVFSLFHDGMEFKKKLGRRIDRKLKIK